VNSDVLNKLFWVSCVKVTYLNFETYYNATVWLFTLASVYDGQNVRLSSV